jgi:large subunit ribosomal protein L9
MKEHHKPKKQLLLLEDVDGLGRSGDIVTPKAPGFVRNYLLPQKKAVIADKSTLSMQARLKEEREKRAVVDRKEAEELAVKIAELTLTTKVKVDPEGKMYGSVTTIDIANLLQEKGYDIRRQHILIGGAIKTLGKHVINVRLKEGVQTKVTLEIEQEASATI